MKHGTAPYLQNPDVTKPHYRGGCTAYRKGVLTHRPLSRLRGLWHAPGAWCQVDGTRPIGTCHFGKYFPKFRGPPSGWWRQGKALTRSFPPMCVRVQQGQAPGILHRCAAVAALPASRWAERATFEGLGRGSMGYVCMNEFHSVVSGLFDAEGRQRQY